MLLKRSSFTASSRFVPGSHTFGISSAYKLFVTDSTPGGRLAYMYSSVVCRLAPASDEPVEQGAIYSVDRGRRHEHLDSVIHYFADRVAGRLHGISRRWRIDSPAAGFCRHLPHFALCFGQKDCLSEGLGGHRAPYLLGLPPPRLLTGFRAHREHLQESP